MKNFMKRIWLFIKHLVAVFVDIIFPIIDLLQAILLLLPIPGMSEFVDKTQKYEDMLVDWVSKIKKITPEIDKNLEIEEEEKTPAPKGGQGSKFIEKPDPTKIVKKN